MPTTEKKPSAKKTTKKEARTQIAKLLETALAGFKESMGEKKFNSSIKKASKLFTISTKPTKATKAVKKVSPVKKAASSTPKKSVKK